MKRSGLSLLMVFIFIFTLASNAFGAKVAAAENTPPSIVGLMAVTMDADTGEIIYAKKMDDRAYPASTTKLMTALLLAENKKQTDTLKYTQSAKAQPEYSLNLNYKAMPIGEGFSGSDAMDALLLYSANDVAYMIADNVAGDATKFQDMMNERIKKLGLKNTHFVSPNGLHDDNHYTTAYDLTVIAREAYKNQWVRETMAKTNSRIQTSSGIILMFDNRNKLVGKDGCVGGKTGYTDKAGRCLVAFYERDGRRLVGVVMKSSYNADDSQVFADMKTIIDWSFKQDRTTIVKKGDAVSSIKDIKKSKITLSYKPLRFFGPTKTVEVPLVLNEDIKSYDNDVNKKERSFEVKAEKLDVWNLKDNTKAATLTVTERESKKEIPLFTSLTTKDIMKANSVLYITVTSAAVVVLIVLITIIASIKRLSSKKSRKRRMF